MSTTFDSALFTRTPGQSGWSQAHIFHAKDNQTNLSKGDLFVVLSIDSEQTIENTRTVRELLGRLHQSYIESTEKPFLGLKKSIALCLTNYSSQLGEIEIVVAALVDEVLFAITVGGAGVALIRGGKHVSIINSGQQEQKRASGYLQEGDTLVIGTSTFFEEFNPSKIISFLTQSNLKDCAETFTKDIYKDEENGSLGALIVRLVKQGTVEDIADDFQEGKLTASEPLTTQANINIETRNLKLENSGQKSLTTKLTSVLRRLTERKFYVRENSDNPGVLRKRKTLASAGILLLTLLIISIIFGIRQKRIGDYKSTYKTELDQAVHQLDEADEVFSLNPARSRELFSLSKETSVKLVEKNVDDPELDNLTKRLAELQGKILGEYRENPVLYVDLNLLSSGFSGDDIKLSDEKFFILDRNAKKIVGIMLDTKRSEVIAGPSVIDEADSLAIYSDKVFVSNSNGIFEVKDRLVKAIEKDWNGEVLIYPYAGNFYILEKDTSIVWRFVGDGVSFGTKRNWLTDGVVVDLSDVVSFSIDGSIWTLGSDGSILKFSLGNKQNFKLDGMYPEMKAPKALFTSDQTDYLYVLDNENSRVLVIEKDGKYKAQYISDEIKNSTSIIVSEKEKKLILLENEKLYSIELKHL